MMDNCSSHPVLESQFNSSLLILRVLVDKVVIGKIEESTFQPTALLHFLLQVRETKPMTGATKEKLVVQSPLKNETGGKKAYYILQYGTLVAITRAEMNQEPSKCKATLHRNSRENAAKIPLLEQELSCLLVGSPFNICTSGQTS